MIKAIGRLLIVVLGIFAASIIARPGSAHIVTEMPWHPIAASYRTMMFLGDLNPVPWNKIRSSFEVPLPAAIGSKSAQEQLLELGGEAEAQAIASAIATENRQALFEAATRGLAKSLRHHLEMASDSLTDPGGAALHIENARSLYRGVEDFILQSDPEGYRELGRAWLSLTSSAGSAGVLGSGGIPPDRQRFESAYKEITHYIGANFEPERFTSRGLLTPLPESVVALGEQVEISPWLPPGSNLNDQDPLPLLVLNFEERGIDEKDLPLIAFGDMLFDSPEIFGNPAKSLGLACSTCHNRSDINQSFLIPGISHQSGAADVDGSFFNALFNDRRDDSLDIPSLRGLRFTGPYGRDGRFASLRDFTRNVIVNEFGGKEPTPFMLDALVGYMLEFDFLPNKKIDREGNLTEFASDAARRGEELFRKPFARMDGKSCASCHTPSANFLDRRAHNIGSHSGGYKGSRDTAFDTPTLLGARFTAPYFHDGSLDTLAAVVSWFDNRFSLGLTESEHADLTSYLEAIGDADQPYEVYEGKHTPFRLAFEELTTFASTLDTLLPARDTFHAKLLIDTVAQDLSADASAMANLSAKDEVYELAAILTNVGKAIDRQDWAEAETFWASFKKLEQQHGAEMY